MIPIGAGTALVTPFTDDGRVDYQALARLAAWQVAEGMNFLVACGSTGEAQTLTPEERELVVRTVVQAVGGRVPVLAGATDNDTSRAVAEARQLSQLGVTGIMSATPYYNKPTQAGMIAHFEAIADAIKVPLLLYNVPGRTGVDLKPETVTTLAWHTNIRGIKEASGSVRRMLDLTSRVPSDFVVLCGDDDIVVPAIAAGAHGLISVAGNAIPHRIADLVTAAMQGQQGQALAEQQRLLPFIDALFAESNPIPIKAALAILGKCGDTVRLPLVPCTPTLREKLRLHLDQLEGVSV
ncbi:MAG: 4-hydroxy-tetrahydrodipicolinate synthase [Gemmatimonadales bacterium]